MGKRRKHHTSKDAPQHAARATTRASTHAAWVAANAARAAGVAPGIAPGSAAGPVGGPGAFGSLGLHLMSGLLALLWTARVVPAWGEFYRIVDRVPLAAWGARMAHVLFLLLVFTAGALLWSALSAVWLRRVTYFASGVR